MTRLHHILLLASLAACLIVWAVASRIQNAETLTLRGYGLELKAEGRLGPPTPAKTGT